ncbi:unnamed protein product [Symbiodinium sp. CCMP2592]|nr:unnamed protein product [Symbiodinium sp. CCMP2592]
MSRRAPSPPPLTASPLTVPDSPSPRSPRGDRTPLAPVMAAPATAEPMPMRLPAALDSPPPSPPSSPGEGDVTPEFALPPLASTWNLRHLRRMTRPSPLSATTPPAPSRGQTLLNPWSRSTSAPFAADASRGLPWILLSCRTLACTGRRCRSGARTRALGVWTLPLCAVSQAASAGACDRPPVDEGAPAGATEHPTPHTHDGPAPWPPPHRPDAHASIGNLGPPPLPFRDGTNSRVYVPLLLDAAGLLPADAQRAWRTHAPIGEWWPAAVAALLARPFIPVRELCTAVEHVSQAFPPQALVSSTLERFWSWAPPRVAQVASLAEVLRAITLADEGHYIAAPLQEALIALLVGAAAASTLERIVDRLRASEPGAALLPAPAAPDSAAPLEAPTHASAPPEAPDAPAPAQPPLRSHVHTDAAARAEQHLASTAQLAAAAARGRRRGRGRGRGRGRHASSPPAASPPAPASAPGDGHDGPPLASQAPALTTAAQRRVSAAESGLLTGLASLDGVDLQDTLQQRLLTLQGVPARLRGALRTALRAGLQLIADRESPAQELRGWKLFCLAPRMLLQRSSGESLIPPAELDRRCDLFARGVWPELLQLASGSAAPRSRTGMPTDDLAARASRATALVHIGELSAAGRALVAEPLAPGTEATLAELRDPSRRPPTPYAPLPQDIATYQAADPCPFPLPAFVACLRSARRGAAAGPSGATNEHVRILLDDEGDTQLLHRAACRLARADLPPPVLAALRVGRLTALQKPNGRGVRALVIGDVLRRLVGEHILDLICDYVATHWIPKTSGLPNVLWHIVRMT